MKKTLSSPSISATLILLGVLINGMVGNTLEMIAHLIDTFQGKSSSKVFLKKFIIIAFSQIMINWIFADNSMTVDMTLWLVEKNYKMIWDGIQMWVAVGNLLTLVRIVNIKKESRGSYVSFFKHENKNKNQSAFKFDDICFVHNNCS